MSRGSKVMRTGPVARKSESLDSRISSESMVRSVRKFPPSAPTWTFPFDTPESARTTCARMNSRPRSERVSPTRTTASAVPIRRMATALAKAT